MLGRGTAAAARHVQEARVGKFAQQGGRVGWQLVKARVAHGVGQARVRVDAHEGVGDLGQLFRVRAHQGGAQCAVQADGQRFCVAHGIPEGGHGLARQDASRRIRDGAGNHQRQAHDARILLVEQVNGEQGRLAVQGIENGFHQQHVGAAFHQALRLLQVGGHQLVEADVARGRVVDVGRDRRRLRRRPEGAGDEARLVRGGIFIAGGARQLGRLHVHFIGQVGHVVIVLRDGRGAEGIRFDQVGAGRQVALVDFLDDVRLRQGQQLIIALDEQFACAAVGRRGEIDEAAGGAATIRFFIKLVLLDDRAHGAVENHDPLRQNGAQGGFGRGHGGDHGIVHFMLSIGKRAAARRQGSTRRMRASGIS